MCSGNIMRKWVGEGGWRGNEKKRGGDCWRKNCGRVCVGVHVWGVCCFRCCCCLGDYYYIEVCWKDKCFLVGHCWWWIKWLWCCLKGGEFFCTVKWECSLILIRHYYCVWILVTLFRWIECVCWRCTCNETVMWWYAILHCWNLFCLGGYYSGYYDTVG